MSRYDDIDPRDIDPATGRPYAGYSSPSLDTSVHDAEMDCGDEPEPKPHEDQENCAVVVETLSAMMDGHPRLESDETFDFTDKGWEGGLHRAAVTIGGRSYGVFVIPTSEGAAQAEPAPEPPFVGHVRRARAAGRAPAPLSVNGFSPSEVAAGAVDRTLGER